MGLFLRRIEMKILMIFIMFLMLGGFFIISEEGLALNNGENVEEFFELYGKWVDSLAVNGKGVVGHVVKMEWLPES